MFLDSITNLYTPLSENEIQYLALLPGQFDDPIECRLIQGRDLPGEYDQPRTCL